MKDTISIDETIEFLNHLIALDKAAVAALIANRVPCNEQLANHPTVRVVAQHGGYNVGLLGILNGLLGTESDEEHIRAPISFVMSPGGDLIRVMRNIPASKIIKGEMEQ